MGMGMGIGKERKGRGEYWQFLSFPVCTEYSYVWTNGAFGFGCKNGTIHFTPLTLLLYPLSRLPWIPLAIHKRNAYFSLNSRLLQELLSKSSEPSLQLQNCLSPPTTTFLWQCSATAARCPLPSSHNLPAAPPLYAAPAAAISR